MGKPKWNLPCNVYLFVAILLFLAALPLPYGFYFFLRVIVCLVAVVLAVRNFEVETTTRSAWPWSFVGIAILFNPLLPVYMTKEVWVVVDLLSCGLFVYLYKSCLGRE